MKPHEIESLSFDIIDKEAGPHDFSPDQWNIVQRVIHTSADFEYMKSIRLHPEAVKTGINSIRAGRPIITDTNMARVGIRKQELKAFGNEVLCYMADPKIAQIANAGGITRAKAAVDAAAEKMAGGIYVVGNAPTALLRVMELVDNKKAAPALIVGLPVGFVNAAESKAKLVKSDICFISNQGRKGGSNVAAAVVNALIIMAAKKL